MSENGNQFLDFDDIKVQSKFKEKFKGIPGEKQRIGIIWPKATDDASKKGPFETRKTHFNEKYFVCKDDICCDKLGPPSQRIACLVIKYKTDKSGQLVKHEGRSIPFDFEVMEWVFGTAKFNQLKDLHKEWDLKTHDIVVACKGNEQYQDLDFTPAKESIWQLKPEFKAAVTEISETSRLHLHKALGAELTLDEIKELLGEGAKVNAEAVISDSSKLDDILNQV